MRKGGMNHLYRPDRRRRAQIPEPCPYADQRLPQSSLALLLKLGAGELYELVIDG